MSNKTNLAKILLGIKTGKLSIQHSNKVRMSVAKDVNFVHSSIHKIITCDDFRLSTEIFYKQELYRPEVVVFKKSPEFSLDINLEILNQDGETISKDDAVIWIAKNTDFFNTIYENIMQIGVNPRAYL